ncbi:hypothetical protein [Paracoccus sp. Ld10]|uniref:hypothetical protein n=1 Tax=Paracoccus sp. Ld10 TaxID=649158 RepID=UPI00386945D3
MFDLLGALTLRRSDCRKTDRFLARRREYILVKDIEQAVALRVAQASMYQPMPSNALMGGVMQSGVCRRSLRAGSGEPQADRDKSPAHITRINAQYRNTRSNRRLSVILPGTDGCIIALTLEQPTARILLPANGTRALGWRAHFPGPTYQPRIRIAPAPNRNGQGVCILSTRLSAGVHRVRRWRMSRAAIPAQLISSIADDFGTLPTITLSLQVKLTAREPH